MSALYRLAYLARRFGQGDAAVDALRGVSAVIEQGESVAVLGPSGCGKSTLLAILGLLDPDFAGDAAFGERSIRTLSHRQRARTRLAAIGFVFQAFHLLPTLSVLDNVAVPHWRLHGDARAARREAAALLAQLGLADRAAAAPKQLSGGEIQRVSVARALVNRPLVVLADEPTGNLDSISQAAVLELLRGVTARGATLVVVTHNAEVAAIASRQLTLRDGRVVADPAPPG